MLSPQALIRGIVQRALPTINPDSTNNDVAIRQGAYGEVYTQPLVRKQHNLADEGSYFVATNNQTAIVPTYGTSLVATSPFITIYNGNTNGQRIYLDYIASGSGSGWRADNDGGLYRSLGGGRQHQPLHLGRHRHHRHRQPQHGIGQRFRRHHQLRSDCTAPAASGSARTVVGLRNLRPSVSTTVINVVGDMNLLTLVRSKARLVRSPLPTPTSCRRHCRPSSLAPATPRCFIFGTR
jgi:hypothetical protein